MNRLCFSFTRSLSVAPNSILYCSTKVNLYCTSAAVSSDNKVKPSTAGTPWHSGKDGLATFTEIKNTDGFIDPKSGKSWPVDLLRKKSFDDLHKLWYILLKERNLLVSERELIPKHERIFKWKAKHRLHKVAQSMARIRRVMWERNQVRTEVANAFIEYNNQINPPPPPPPEELVSPNIQYVNKKVNKIKQKARKYNEKILRKKNIEKYYSEYKENQNKNMQQ